MSSIGSEIRKARLERGMSQSQLARRSGVTQGLITRLETGRTKHTAEKNVNALMKALGNAEKDAPSNRPDSANQRSFAEAVREARNSLGWSRATLARRAKVSEGTIMNVESGKSTSPSAATKKRLKRALGLKGLTTSNRQKRKSTSSGASTKQAEQDHEMGRIKEPDLEAAIRISARYEFSPAAHKAIIDVLLGRRPVESLPNGAAEILAGLIAVCSTE